MDERFGRNSKRHTRLPRYTILRLMHESKKGRCLETLEPSSRNRFAGSKRECYQALRGTWNRSGRNATSPRLQPRSYRSTRSFDATRNTLPRGTKSVFARALDVSQRGREEQRYTTDVSGDNPIRCSRSIDGWLLSRYLCWYPPSLLLSTKHRTDRRSLLEIEKRGGSIYRPRRRKFRGSP